MKVFRKNQSKAVFLNAYFKINRIFFYFKIVERLLLKINRNRLCETNSEKEEPERLPQQKEIDRLPSGFFFRYHFKKMFSFYYNLRYLNVFSLSNPGEVYKHSLERYALPKTKLFLEESKFEELFELADKSEYLGASMLEVDIAEINSIDNFKENYTFTVNRLLNIF